ncbi:inositol monophosphatase family protein [Bacteroides heparinolyticus]|uniref:inositol monophosphatase family protein n=2 Tax=Prevotella heparinolytica TaxID=28113 RepID=UPI0035A09143
MEDLQILTEAVCRIAREAGHFLKEERKNFHREAVVEKRAHDYVSYVDKESEKRIVAALRQLLPDAGFIAEEGSAVYHDEPYCWVVDPLDGTTNYIHDNAPYCVSIALRDKHSLLLGVVYEPCRDECFYAWKGGGAYVNGEAMRVSAVENAVEAFVVTELPYNFEQYARTGEHLIRELYGKVAGIRMNGSAALALCYVAAGRFDAWLEAFIGKWDFSAAALMVLEAGGKVTDFYGNENFMDGHHIIATNGPLHPLLLQLVKEVPPHNM